MAPKHPKDIHQQIALLLDRNMAFRNIDEAPHFLSNISYYRLKGYWWEMQADKATHFFKAGSYFEDAIMLYNFDRNFRLILFNAIERIEISIRTKLIYHLSLSFGPYWHLDQYLFDKSNHFLNVKSKINSAIEESSEEFIKAHKDKHSDTPPEAWKALEVVTLGTLSKLYRNLKHQLPEKSTIATEVGLTSHKHLASWLTSITLTRNIIAHHGRLWNRIIINKYDWPNHTPAPLLNYVPTNFERRKIFPLLCAIIYLNNFISPGHHIKKELFDLFLKFNTVPLRNMGFPDNWEEQPIWQE
jgi:abortive infection bacteriophage resistance protein